MKICIDAGHGGSDPGAVGLEPFELREKDVTLAVALCLRTILSDRRHQVVMTRDDDRTLRLAERTALANEERVDLFVSVHANSVADQDPEGIEVFHLPGSLRGAAVAVAVMTKLAEAFPDHRNRGTKQAGFFVLRHTLAPAVLVETEFISNPQQLQFLADPDNQQRLALAIADGIAVSDQMLAGLGPAED